MGNYSKDSHLLNLKIGHQIWNKSIILVWSYLPQAKLNCVTKHRNPHLEFFFLSRMAVISNWAPPWEFGPYFIYRSHFSFDFGVPCNWSVIFITGSLASSLLCQLKCPSNEWDQNFEKARTGMGQFWSGPGPGFFIQFAIGQDWSIRLAPGV